MGDDLPADSNKIDGVITSLLEGSATWPVATSASSQERFEVTAESHQRRLAVESEGETVAEIFLGTSPGFRRVHARSSAGDAVYSIDFAVHEVPVDEDEWLDKKLLQTEEISEVTLSDGGKLLREADGDGWLVDGTAADPEAVSRLIDRLEGLSVLGLHDGEPAEPGESRVIALVDAEGSHRLTLSHDEAEDEYVLTTDRFPGAFNVASYIAEQILIDASELLPEPEPEPEPEAEEEEPGAAEAADVDV
jgi:hypothetical protein